MLDKNNGDAMHRLSKAINTGTDCTSISFDGQITYYQDDGILEGIFLLNISNLIHRSK